MIAYLTTVCNNIAVQQYYLIFGRYRSHIPVNRLGVIAVVRRTSAKIRQIAVNWANTDSFHFFSTSLRSMLSLEFCNQSFLQHR